ncbi:lytic transglycosylase domain-containing protein [Profundibacterium mesophilum]|nr:lytic transglycosylase domain-containing protein [Profundibacterium mesophilum]
MGHAAGRAAETESREGGTGRARALARGLCALICAAAFSGLAAPQALAETQEDRTARREVVPPPFADFTFKRLKPPAPGTKRRITVQITQPPPPAAIESARAAAVPAARGALDWFWREVPPAGAGLGGVDAALAVLRNAPAGQRLPEPRLDALRKIAAIHGREILLATIGTRVSPALVLAVIAVESGGRADARSRAGAAGLMQLMPDTAARFGVRDSLHPPENIRGGVTYLDWLMSHFDNDPVLALAGYNAGEGAVRSHAGVPPFAETRSYVPKVLTAWNVARGLCLTPPRLITDGCVLMGRGRASNG